MFPDLSPRMEVRPSTDHKYSLRWPDHHNTVLDTFRSLKEEEDFIDVTLSCEDSQYTAHKVVLSACSPYFRKLLKSNPCQHPIIILRDVREEDLGLLLAFMYAGEVEVDQDRINSFLRTAEMLQIKGLLDHPLREQCQKTSSTSLSNNEQREADDYSPMAKRIRTGALSPSLLPCRDTSADSVTRHNGDRDPWTRPMSPKMEHSLVESSSLHKYEHTNGSNGGDNKSSSLLSQALLEKSGSRDEREETRDSVSDDDSSERGAGSASIDTIKSDREMRDCEPPSTPIFPPGLEALYRQAGFPPFLGLGGHSGHPQAVPQAPTVTHVGLQSHAANPTVGGMLSDMHPVNVGGKLEMMRVRATDPRPCPKCGKIYRSAHTLRTHMEDKHTLCPGYRCVLCGTVAKSRNSLHSHMSRQHRGISTKDLPVLPMPAPFDPELASKLLSKAGVKVSPTELAARASPTAPRRSDLPKLDNNLAMQNANQFPLPASLPPAHLQLSRERSDKDGHEDPEDLRLPMSSPLSSPSFSSAHYASPITSLTGGAPSPLGFPNSAIIKTYMEMIARAGGDVTAATQALNFPNGGAGLMGLGMPPFNGKEDRYASDREDDGELGSDAENEDMSDNEEMTHAQNSGGPGARETGPISVPVNNGGDH